MRYQRIREVDVTASRCRVRCPWLEVQYRCQIGCYRSLWLIDSITEPTASGHCSSNQCRLRPPQLLPQLVSAEQVLKAKHHGSGNGLESLAVCLPLSWDQLTQFQYMSVLSTNKAIRDSYFVSDCFMVLISKVNFNFRGNVRFMTRVYGKFGPDFEGSTIMKVFQMCEQRPHLLLEMIPVMPSMLCITYITGSMSKKLIPSQSTTSFTAAEHQ